MKNLEQIFFELIRVAIGTQSGLTRTPSASEWKRLYVMAKKQSLVGVCFAGVQRLRKADEANGTHVTVNLPEMGYVKWMGMAAKIQRKNEKVNKQCVELQEMLAADGLRSCILKGQGVGALYKVSGERLEVSGERSLSDLRQSGDIDVWVDASKEDVVAWAEKVGISEEAGYLHVGVSCFEDTDVELHYRPTYMRSLRHNRRIQEFCDGQKGCWVDVDGMMVPSWKFNVVYLLSHIYRHLFGLGVGLRQMMDYYFVLNTNRTKFTNVDLLKGLGLLDFAGAVMWVMKEVFGMDDRYLICSVDEKRGKMLLELVMQTGNFGMLDKEQKEARSTKAGSMMYKLKQWWRLVWYYPEETLSAPVWNVCKGLMD